MVDEAERLARRLLEEGAKTVDFFRTLPPKYLDQELYTEGSHWTVGQVLAHFLATEIGIYTLVASILEGNPGVPQDFDLDRYNEKKILELRDLSLSVLLDRFIEQRRHNAEAFAGLSELQLRTEGRHPFLGRTYVEEIIKMLYRHNQIHQRDIRRKIAETRLSDEHVNE